MKVSPGLLPDRDATHRPLWPNIVEFWQYETLGVFDGWIEQVFLGGLVQKAILEGFNCAELYTGGVVGDIALLRHSLEWPLNMKASSKLKGWPVFRKLVWEGYINITQYEDAEVWFEFGLRAVLDANRKMCICNDLAPAHPSQLYHLGVVDGSANSSVLPLTNRYVANYSATWNTYRIEYFPSDSVAEGRINIYLNNQLVFQYTLAAPFDGTLNTAWYPYFKLEQFGQDGPDRLLIGPWRFYYVDEFDVVKRASS